VRQAGGHIWLYSEPGRGTTFKLYLPRTDAAQGAAQPRSRTVARGTGRVLVVEDDAAVRTVTVQMLERAGYEVTAVPDGRAAMAAIEAATERFGVVVSDVVMPHLSGIELADWVWERDPGIGMVLLSGYTSDAVDVERARDRGAAFLSKPATFRALMEAMEEVARRGRPEESSPGPPAG
jgi:DNA-binding NtrC family response regulator